MLWKPCEHPKHVEPWLLAVVCMISILHVVATTPQSCGPHGS